MTGDAYVCAYCVEHEERWPSHPHTCDDHDCTCECQIREVTFTARMPAGLHRRATTRAHEEERSLMQVVRLALRRYLDEPATSPELTTVTPPRHQSDTAQVPARHRDATAPRAGDSSPVEVQEIPPVGSPNGSAATKPKLRRRPATPLPPDWQPGGTHCTLAAELGVDVTLEEAKLRDYCEQKDWRNVDWDAAFRNWLRKSAADPRSNGARASPGKAAVSTSQDEADWIDPDVLARQRAS